MFLLVIEEVWRVIFGGFEPGLPVVYFLRSNSLPGKDNVFCILPIMPDFRDGAPENLEELLTVSGEPPFLSFDVNLETASESPFDPLFFANPGLFEGGLLLTSVERFNAAPSFFYRALFPITVLIFPLSSLLWSF